MRDQHVISTMQRIGELLLRRMHDELTLTDKIELDNWLNEQDISSKKFFEEVTEWDEIHAALQDMYSIDMEAAMADIQKKILVLSTPVEPLRMSRSLAPIRKFRFLAAAVVLVIVASGTVFYISNRRKTEIVFAPIAERYKNDIIPGGEKAILELADGRKIVLENAANGELTKQGVTKVVKLENGKLSYASTKIDRTVPLTFNTISTPKGGQYQIVLPDGSKVWLNAASSLRFPTAFTTTERSVELSGEAYFEVARNSSMPFHVMIARPGDTEHVRVDVLGTEFNVMSYADEADQRTTLIEGAVKVATGNKDVSIKPSEQLRIRSSNGIPSLNAAPIVVNTDEVIAWKKGLFQFRDASIQDIMRQASRWYDVDVVYEGAINQQFVGTIPRRANISTMLKILEATGWVHFKIEGKTIIVSQ